MAIQTAPSIALTTSSIACSTLEQDKQRHHQCKSRKATTSSPNNVTSENDMCTSDLSDNSGKIAFIISQLSPEELEILSRCAYRYLKNPVPSRRNIFAKRVVYRCLKSKKGNTELGLAKVKKLIDFRRKANIDELITAFDEDNNHGSNDTSKTLQKHLASKKFYVQGFDKEGRSTLYFIPRNVVDHDLDSAIYSIERALACSRSLDSTINCVVDFSEFPLSNAPSMEIGKQFLSTLRVIYAGQINRIFLVNVPFTFSILWNMFSPFVGTDTRGKITIFKNNRKEEKEREILNLYDLEELPHWAVSGGQKNRSIDVDEYLFALPFDSAFDSVSK